MDDRLTKSDWIAHGLKTLASAGAGALKVGSMAAQLNVSRGSFYWHFGDIADFRAQLPQSRQERMTDSVIRDIAGQAEPDRLRHLMRRAFVESPRLDRAIRSWGAENEDVATIVAGVDARRVAYIAQLLEAAGVVDRTARQRAAFLY